MEIDRVPIPNTVVEAMCDLVEGIGEADLIEQIPQFLPGHQKKRQNVKHVRERIKTMLRRERNPNPNIATLLRGVGLARELVVVLSEMALKTGFKDLAKERTQENALKARKADFDREIKKANKQRKTDEAKLAKAEVESDRLRAENVTIREQREVESMCRSDAERELVELQESVSQRIDEGVADALADRLRAWLMPVRNVESGITHANQSTLLDRAADALHKQRSIDRKSGTRAELNVKIEQRREVLAEVQSAQIDSLNPLPELAGIATDLDQEIRSLETALGISADTASAVTIGLLAKINAAHTLDDLSRIRRFIGRAASYDLLDDKSRERLYRSTNDKVGLIYDQASMAGEEDPAASSEAGFFLQHAAAKGEAFTLFLDGHNILHRVKDIFGPYYEDGEPGRKARHELARRTTRLFDKSGQNVLLFFDSDERAEESLSDQVHVIYSGGTGPDRADRAILEHMRAYQEMGKPDTICLIARDADFERDASELGAVVLDPEDFAVSFDLRSV